MFLIDFLKKIIYNITTYILIELENLRKDLNDLENNPTSLEIQNLEERLKSLDITVIGELEEI